MKDPERAKQIKAEVKKHYGRVILAVSEEPSPCCGGGVPRGKYAAMAGYTPEQLQSLPEGMTVESFGCGNPLDLLDVEPGETILDLGCGPGLDLFLAAGKVGPGGRVIGVDMTPEMIARARQNIARSGLTNIEVRQGEMEALPVDDNSVDRVISNCVINLSPDKDKVFAEIFRILKPGGRMLVADIVAVGDLPREIREDMDAWAGCIGGALPESDYLRAAETAGLVEVAVVDRYVYDRSHLDGFSSGCCSSDSGCFSAEMIERLAGKIASVKVTAKKPT